MLFYIVNKIVGVFAVIPTAWVTIFIFINCAFLAITTTISRIRAFVLILVTRNNLVFHRQTFLVISRFANQELHVTNPQTASQHPLALPSSAPTYSRQHLSCKQAVYVCKALRLVAYTLVCDSLLVLPYGTMGEEERRH